MTVTNSNNSSTTPSVSEIGSSFVETYYGIMAKSPQKLYLLYKQDSQITHAFSSDSESYHYQGKQIQAAVQDLINSHAKNVKVKFHLVESQSSINDSLFVTVHGAFHKNNSSDVINFYQSFILAPQTNGYYVLNDILRLDTKANGRDVDVDSTAATMGEGSVQSFSEEEIHSIESATNEDKDTTDLKEELTAKKSDKKVNDDEKKKKQSNNNSNNNKKKTDEKKPAVDATSSSKPQNEGVKQQTTTTTATPVTVVPTSYAAIVGGDEYVTVIQQSNQIKLQQEQQAKADRKKRTGPKPDKKKAPKNANPDEQVFEKKPKKKFERKQAEEVKPDEDGFEQKKPKKYAKRFEKFPKKFNSEEKEKRVFDDNKFGIYVAKVEPTTTAQQLQEIFSKYGEIVDMNNRSNANEKNPNFKLGYALIFYNNQESVNKAVEDKEITVNGTKVDVTVHSRKKKIRSD